MDLAFNSVWVGTVVQLGAICFGHGIKKLTEWTSYKPPVPAPATTKDLITTFTSYKPPVPAPDIMKDIITTFTGIAIDTPSIIAATTTITAPCASGSSLCSPETPNAVIPTWLKVTSILGLFNCLLFLVIAFFFVYLVRLIATHANNGNGPTPGEHNTLKPPQKGASPVIIPDDEVKHSEVATAAGENHLAPPSAIESAEALESTPTIEDQVNKSPSSSKRPTITISPPVDDKDYEIESDTAQNAADSESSVKDAADTLKPATASKKKKYRSPSDIRSRFEKRAKWKESKKAEYGEQS